MRSVQGKTIYMGIAVLTIMCLIGSCACALGSIGLRKIKMTEQRKEAEQKRVSEVAHEISDALYAPDYSVVLDEVEADDLLAYAPGCTGTVIQIAFGSYQPFREVMADYHPALLEAGWILHPGYTTNPYEDYVVYKKDERTQLSVDRISEGDTTLASIHPTATRHFLTIYTITIRYTEPSNLECTG
jgi:hypothetical protein